MIIGLAVGKHTSILIYTGNEFVWAKYGLISAIFVPVIFFPLWIHLIRFVIHSVDSSIKNPRITRPLIARSNIFQQQISYRLMLIKFAETHSYPSNNHRHVFRINENRNTFDKNVYIIYQSEWILESWFGYNEKS